MKTLLQAFVLCLIAAFVSGCEEKVTPSKLQGTWKIVNSTNYHIVGDTRNFLDDGRCIAYDRIGFTRCVVRYTLDNKIVKFSKDNGDLLEAYDAKFEKGLLILQDPEDGFIMKMKRIED